MKISDLNYYSISIITDNYGHQNETGYASYLITGMIQYLKKVKDNQLHHLITILKKPQYSPKIDTTSAIWYVKDRISNNPNLNSSWLMWNLIIVCKKRWNACG